MNPGMTPVAAALAEWGIALRDDDVPGRIREAAVRHLADGFGTAAAAVRSGAVAPVVEVARRLGGPPEATLLGGPDRVGSAAAALATGALVHAHDFDDTHAGGLVHPTAVVLPAALAVGQAAGATGRDLVTAAVVGYETVCRIAAAVPNGFHDRGLHATSAAGVFAAALVTARLSGLDGARATDALGIAGSSAGGLLEFLGSAASTKQLHPGLASMNGVTAALLAGAGATGPATVLEGQRGLYAALVGAPPDLDVVGGDLGRRWETGRIGIKPYPACQLMHATLDAVAAAVAGREVRPADVAEVVAAVHPDSAAVVCDPDRDLTRPRGPYDAKFSLPWSVAALLLDGSVSESTYAVDSVQRAEVAALAGRVRTESAPSDRVAADACGRVRIRLRDGQVLEGAVDRSAGGPDAPLSTESLRAKFLANAGGGPAAHRLWLSLVALDELGDLSDLTDQFLEAVVEEAR
ncbi:MmgE/PrpD family protein [Nocardioides soli]|uniref:2-methylcitrate dehydratase PrpD n=1 Tax=Nocardioides soli TaxID=1036020 RepID=A0A7W4VTK4_9ACTN|nr:MmgE/PrpD family protein [Nocardioides soli]MBB3041543.1 2-methylcitrate dehydratase PrpD [Nocardioides soli]